MRNIFNKTSFFQRNSLIISKGIFITMLVVIFILTFKSPSLFFSSPTCQIPCAFNVVPGITRIEEANKIIGTTVKGGFITTGGYIRFGNKGTLLNVFLFPTDPKNGNYVQSIKISSDRQNQVLSLGDLINEGYIPHRVFRNEVVANSNQINFLITFGNDDHMIAELSPQDKLNARSAIHNLTFSYAPEADWVLFGELLTGNYRDEIDWIGYADVNEYLQLTVRKSY
jgi:hypothetical protein